MKSCMLVQVDAALDLSHTQNIGYVLKNHFAKSQFLVVSTGLTWEAKIRSALQSLT